MNFTESRFFFRADGNSKIGLGHIIRCLSLIEMLQQWFECFFLIRDSEEQIKKSISEHCQLIELKSDIANEATELLGLLKPGDILVTDGYNYDTNYQQTIKSSSYKLVMIDDKADDHYYADLIINHGDASLKNKYNKESYTKVLTGFQYLIIRKAFLDAAKIKRRISKVNTAFICMGGADPFNITVKALQACIECDFIKRVIIVTGSAYNNKTELNTLIDKKNADKTILHEENVTANRMVELIRMSEIAISPASSISLEICSVKAGLLTGTVIDNQLAIHRQLVDSECCISLGDFNTLSIKDIKVYLQKLSNVDLVNAIMRKQAQAIDGLSGDRILSEFKHLAEC